MAVRFSWLPVLLLCFSGCAERSAASEYVRKPSTAISPDTPSALRKEFLTEMRVHAKKSGVRLVLTGTDAFLSRIAMVRMAQHSIDVQYYAIQDDITAKIFLSELQHAADRGVRVRMLIDGMNLSEIDDTAVVFDTHPKIEVRAFNPLNTADDPFWTRMTNYVTEFDRFTRRMHNKVLIADNQVAIMGGRNIGDTYFDSSDEFNFSDVDVLSVGPATAGLSRSFDRYWNSDESFPMETVDNPTVDAALIKRVQEELQKNEAEFPTTPLGEKLKGMSSIAQIRSAQLPLTWAPVELRVDRPDKIQADDPTSPPTERLEALLVKARTEFLCVSPYLVPKEEGVKMIESLVDKGMKVRILTNSLAATDVVPVHTAYSRYRKDLLEAGANLYEFKPIPGKRSRQSVSGSSSRSSLHAKVYVIDRNTLVVGSFNFDPRSAELNTEQALIIPDAGLTQKIVKMFEETTDPASSYHVTMDEHGKLLWETKEKGQIKQYHRDPDAGIMRNSQYFVFSLLPLEDQM